MPGDATVPHGNAVTTGVVWEPMEAIYAEGKGKPNAWDSGTPPEVAAAKHNELSLPDGLRP